MRLHTHAIVTGAIASAAGALLYAEIHAPSATAIDPTSPFRGSLGASLADLSLSDDFGRLSLLLNGGFALLFGAFAILAAAGFPRGRVKRRQPQGDDQTGQTVHLT